MRKRERIIVALDTQDFQVCKKWVRSLRGLIRFFKVGSELFTAVGKDAVRFIQDEGASVFLDLKFHDIPHTVAQSVRAASRLGVNMINVHTLGGSAMMRAAVEALAGETPRPLLLGVTLLTSHAEKDLSREIGIPTPLKREVLRLAGLAGKAGLDGVVASAEEAARIKKKMGGNFKVVTPGIRLSGGSRNDQVRVVTPRRAFLLGSDYLVIGRPITGAKSPRETAEKFLLEIDS